MRLSKIAWLVLGIGIFVIAFAAIFSIYSGQSGEKERLSDSLATSRSLLPKLIAQRGELEGQLTQWQSTLAEATSSLSKTEVKFPKSVESIEYDETLFKIADDCDLQVIELAASEPTNKEEKEADITYAVTTFEVVVQSKELPPSTAGDFETYIDETVANILDFIHAIATSKEFNVGTIEVLDMKNLEPPAEISGDEEGPEAAVKLIIYGFPR